MPYERLEEEKGQNAARRDDARHCARVFAAGAWWSIIFN